MTQFNHQHYLWGKFWTQARKDVQFKLILEIQCDDIITCEINQQVRESVWNIFSERTRFLIKDEAMSHLIGEE